MSRFMRSQLGRGLLLAVTAVVLTCSSGEASACYVEWKNPYGVNVSVILTIQAAVHGSPTVGYSSFTVVPLGVVNNSSINTNVAGVYSIAVQAAVQSLLAQQTLAFCINY